MNFSLKRLSFSFEYKSSPSSSFQPDREDLLRHSQDFKPQCLYHGQRSSLSDIQTPQKGPRPISALSPTEKTDQPHLARCVTLRNFFSPAITPSSGSSRTATSPATTPTTSASASRSSATRGSKTRRAITAFRRGSPSRGTSTLPPLSAGRSALAGRSVAVEDQQPPPLGTGAERVARRTFPLTGGRCTLAD